MEEFIITRVYSDSHGDSLFEDIKIPLSSAGAIGYLSDRYNVESMVFRKVLPSYDYDFHTAPARQFIILLDGKIEIETSLGEKRIFIAGDILQMDDTTGKGHKTRNLEATERRSVFITLR
ncbi:MAG TPA: hypothetical protein VGD22_11670 [Sphingobacteriaceae bacterium]